MSELNQKGLPPQLDVEIQLLKYLRARGNSVPARTVYKELAEIMKIDKNAMQAKRDSEGRNLWENLVRFARRRLVDNGTMNSEPHGMWSAKE